MATGFAADGSTLALYKLNETGSASTAADTSGNSYTLGVTGSPPSAPGLVRGEYSRHTLTGALLIQASHTAALLTATGPSISLTWEAIIFPMTGIGSATDELFSYSGNGGGSPGNSMGGLYTNFSGVNKGTLTLYHHHGATLTTNSIITSAAGVVLFDAWNYVVGIREWTGSQYNLYVYCNNVLVGTLLNATAPDGGGTALKLSIGSRGGSNVNFFSGLVDEARLSNVVRTPTEIAAVWAATFLPGVPTGVTAIPASGQAVVYWDGPILPGASPITGYTVTSSPGGFTASAAVGVNHATVTGLTNGTAYTFTVTATNTQGTSAASSASGAVTPGTVVSVGGAGTNFNPGFN